MDSENKKAEIATRFLDGLRHRDRNLLSSIMSDEVVWSMPGSSLLSGRAQGIDAVIARAQMIVDYGMKFEVGHIQIGWSGVALSLHNFANRGDLVFDEHLVTVLSLRDEKVFAIDTYMSDVEMVNAFFIPL